MNVRCRRCGSPFAVPKRPAAGDTPSAQAVEPPAPRPARADAAGPTTPARAAPQTGLVDDLPSDPYVDPAGAGDPAGARDAGLFGPSDGFLGAVDADAPAFEAEAAPPPAPETAAAPSAQPSAAQRRPTGMSAIRAQSTRNDIPAYTPDAADVPRSDWLVRTPDGEILRFPDFDRVRAWLAANPGIQVTLSSDGSTWRAPESILGFEAGAELQERTARPLPKGASVALRPEAAARARRRRPAGAGWKAGAILSTLFLLGTAVYTVQNLGIADLSGVVPFHLVGLDHLAVPPARPAPPPETRPEPTAPAPERLFSEALARARAARSQERLVDAAVAYQQALSHREDPETLAELVETYALLGDDDRADAARRRLADLKTEQAPKP